MDPLWDRPYFKDDTDLGEPQLLKTDQPTLLRTVTRQKFGSLSIDVMSRIANGNRKLIFFLLTRFDTIVSVMASHQTSKQDFSNRRLHARGKTSSENKPTEQLTYGCRSWLTDVCA